MKVAGGFQEVTESGCGGKGGGDGFISPLLVAGCCL